jgi:hypothetical protein
MSVSDGVTILVNNVVVVVVVEDVVDVVGVTYGESLGQSKLCAL